MDEVGSIQLDFPSITAPFLLAILLTQLKVDSEEKSHYSSFSLNSITTFIALHTCFPRTDRNADSPAHSLHCESILARSRVITPPLINTCCLKNTVLVTVFEEPPVLSQDL